MEIFHKTATNPQERTCTLLTILSQVLTTLKDVSEETVMGFLATVPHSSLCLCRDGVASFKYVCVPVVVLGINTITGAPVLIYCAAHSSFAQYELSVSML